MREITLQKLWESKWLAQKKLQTLNLQEIKIIDFGSFNTLQGPDFKEAKIILDTVECSGSIEIHVKSSYWNLHNHQTDKNYNQVVLHVVWEWDGDVYDAQNRLLPTLELKQFVTPEELKFWTETETISQPFPCMFFHQSIALEDKILQLQTAYQLRLHRKKQQFQHILNDSKGDWEQSIFQLFARYWMNEQNRFSMEFMAQQSVLNRLKKFSHCEMMAYWFGMSGLKIPTSDIEFGHTKIWDTFIFLKKKFGYESVELPWFYGKIRPAAHPDVRMLQWVNWLYGQRADMSRWLKLKSLQELLYDFNAEQSTKLGNAHTMKMILNVIVPVWLHYAEQFGMANYQVAALNLLEQMPPEQNSEVQKMVWLNLPNDTLSQSQSLMAQNEFYCSKKKCLECNLGKIYLRKTQSDAILL